MQSILSKLRGKLLQQTDSYAASESFNLHCM